MNKFLYFEYVSGLYNFVVFGNLLSRVLCDLKFFLSYASREQKCISSCCSPLHELVFLKGPLFDIWYN